MLLFQLSKSYGISWFFYSFSGSSFICLYIYIYKDCSKCSKPYPEREHRWTLLLWQHTTISYKMSKTNSDFCLNFCVQVSFIEKWELCNKSKILVRLEPFECSSYTYIVLNINKYTFSKFCIKRWFFSKPDNIIMSCC